MSTEHDRVIEEVKVKQQNTVWPDTMINGRSVDEFLWKGSSDATLVQRVGAWWFGAFFIVGGASWLGIGLQQHDRVFQVLSIFWFLIGGRIFLNGFRKRKTRKSQGG